MPFSYNIIELRIWYSVLQIFLLCLDLCRLFHSIKCLPSSCLTVSSWLNWIKFFRGWPYLHLYWCGTGPTDLDQKYSTSTKQSVSRKKFDDEIRTENEFMHLTHSPNVLLKSHYITEADDLPDLLFWLEHSRNPLHLYAFLFINKNYITYGKFKRNFCYLIWSIFDQLSNDIHMLRLWYDI